MHSFLGSVFADLGKPEQALEHLGLALKIRRQIGDREGEGSSLALPPCSRRRGHGVNRREVMGGLGAAGLTQTSEALANGQVHELLLAANPSAIAGTDGHDPADIAEALVMQAHRTSALVTFVEDAALLAPAGGVAARLRYRMGGRAA